jgi:CHAD domain-containing protein
METEAKFILPDAATFAHLQDLEQIGPYTRYNGQVKHVHDRYVDTPDHRFYRRQFYARLREGGDQLLLTLKRLGVVPEGAVHARDEYQTPVPGLEIAAWPEGEARRLAEEIAGDQPLTDLVHLDQTRHVARLHEGERAVAEMSLDEVVIPALDGPIRAYEVEVELLPGGTLADLGVLARVFADEYHLAAQPQSKFERALSLAGIRIALMPDDGGVPTVALPADPPPPDPVQALEAPSAGLDVPAPRSGQKRQAGVLPTDSMATATRKVLRMNFAALLAKEEGTRTGEDIEDLHDMRVATRRMRAALRIAAPYLSGKSVARVGRELRTVARALGAVRDLDVLIEHARQFRYELPADAQAGMDGLLTAWGEQREKARRKMLRLLESRDYDRFTRHMAAFLDEADAAPDQADGAVPYQVRHVAGSAVWARYEEVRAYETLMDHATVPQLHALRITGKYLRYTLEFFKEVLPADAGALIRDVVGMQDELGLLHDADVAAGLIRDYVTTLLQGKRKRRPAGPPPGLADYLANREAAVIHIRDHFGATWATLTGPDWRARLAAALAAV